MTDGVVLGRAKQGHSCLQIHWMVSVERYWGHLSLVVLTVMHTHVTAAAGTVVQTQHSSACGLQCTVVLTLIHLHIASPGAACLKHLVVCMLASWCWSKCWYHFLECMSDHSVPQCIIWLLYKPIIHKWWHFMLQLNWRSRHMALWRSSSIVKTWAYHPGSVPCQRQVTLSISCAAHRLQWWTRTKPVGQSLWQSYHQRLWGATGQWFA